VVLDFEPNADCEVAVIRLAEPARCSRLLLWLAR